MDRLLKKLHRLLPILVGAFIVTGCAADTGQETAVPPTAEQMQPEKSQEALVTENQDLTSLPEKNPAIEPPAADTPSPTGVPTPDPLPVIAPAPAWHNETWINTDTPLPLEDLRGKVVLLEFWTFG